MIRNAVLFGLGVAAAAQAQVRGYDDEAEFLADVAALGYATIAEDFEGAGWDHVRSPAQAPAVVAQGLTWTGNGAISTNSNWARGSGFGVYTTAPSTGPEVFVIESDQTLYAAGGWIRAAATDIGIRIDGVVVAERVAPHYTYVFLGVIDEAGFTRVEFADIEEESVMGGDDFVFAIASACTADLDGDGDLTLFDFLAFQNLFDLMDPAADFDGDGDFTIFDFLAFQNAFDLGCP